ncbi:MAG: TldD/PmbA family protein [Methanomassiliicoccales archaeon]|nr:TldD/PmbA family protein [Methanomassiliicoccales archaeon]MDD1755207.1 TldD/PmbA family protein [Methanomassiliicoccales archaeon]
MEDNLEFALSLALAQGASYAEARFQSDYYESNLLKNGEPEVASFETRKGMSFRVIVNGGMAFGATNQLTKKDIRAVVKRILASAKQAGRANKVPISMGKAELGQGRVEIRPRVSFDAVGLDGRIQLLKEADAEAVGAAERKGTRLPGRYFSLDTIITEKTVINSDGAKVYSRIPKVALDMFMTAFHPERGSVQRMLNLGESAGWEGVERWDVPRLLHEEVEALSEVLLKAEAAKEEQGDVILGPEVVGIVSHESSGHPGEADRILGREAAQAGEAYLKRDSLGLKVGSEVVNVVEDPTLPRSFGFYLYDDEGVKARKRYLIKEGRINEFLHNRSTAHAMGVESNASSRSVAFNREPIVRMANTFVEPGDLSFDELIEGVDYGVYIKNFMEWNIDDRRYNQRYVGLEAYRIEDGELRSRLRNPVLEITTPGLWSAVDAVGKDLKFTAAYCGKGDPMQGIPVWTGGPHIRLRGIRLGGMA